MNLVHRIREYAATGFSSVPEQVSHDSFHVYVVNPLDFHDCSTVEFGDFLKQQCWRLGSDESDCGPVFAILAATIASLLACWDSTDDSQMSVAHDVSMDSPIFIFKQKNNGTTILVSLPLTTIIASDFCRDWFKFR
jgi:hypothetical protein